MQNLVSHAASEQCDHAHDRLRIRRLGAPEPAGGLALVRRDTIAEEIHLTDEEGGARVAAVRGGLYSSSALNMSRGTPALPLK